MAIGLLAATDALTLEIEETLTIVSKAVFYLLRELHLANDLCDGH